jgi:hypothetical protein
MVAWNLWKKTFRLQSFDAAPQALVIGEYVVVLSNGNLANQNVCRSTLNTASPANVKQPRGFFVMSCQELLVGEEFERTSQFFKLNQVFNA